jgi:peptidoglycan L-alanyl-D-glutamate endopeptidase CwlK
LVLPWAFAWPLLLKEENMAFVFGTSSKAELKTVHPDLVKLSNRALALSTVDFRILQGIRTFDEQLKAFEGGFSKIDPRKTKGRHMVGCAVDFIVIDPDTNKITWGKPKLWAKVREAYYQASKELGIPIRTLEKIGDLGHVELPKSHMPDNWKSK